MNDHKYGGSKLVALLQKFKTNPYYFTLFLFLLIFLLIYAERIFGFQEDIYHYAMSGLLIAVSLFIIVLTITYNFGVKNKTINTLDSMINSSSSKNVIALFIFLFFVIYIYEIALYDNNYPYRPLDIITFGNNEYVSNRSMGIMLIIFMGLLTGYTISINSAPDDTNV